MEWICMTSREVEGHVLLNLQLRPPESKNRVGHIWIRKLEAHHMPDAIGISNDAIVALKERESRFLNKNFR